MFLIVFGSFIFLPDAISKTLSLAMIGKTTTMGIVTGDITPTCGEAYVAGYDVTGVTKDGVQLARKNIGFCPQVDPLLDLMTARETLKMFGQLRGIPSEILVCNP